VDAWDLGADGTYTHTLKDAGTKAYGAQDALMARYARNDEGQRGV